MVEPDTREKKIQHRPFVFSQEAKKKKERIGVERFYFTVIVLTSTYKEDFEPKKFLEENVLLVVSFAEF